MFKNKLIASLALWLVLFILADLIFSLTFYSHSETQRIAQTSAIPASLVTASIVFAICLFLVYPQKNSRAFPEPTTEASLPHIRWSGTLTEKHGLPSGCKVVIHSALGNPNTHRYKETVVIEFLNLTIRITDDDSQSISASSNGSARYTITNSHGSRTELS